MQKLREIITKYNRWSGLEILVERVEAARKQDFSLAFENIKALLESVCKEICLSCGVTLSPQSNMNGTVRSCFSAMNFANSSAASKISSSLANIGQFVGELRNETGVTGHGRTVEEIRQRNARFDEFTKEFLLDSIVTVIIFLIRAFEAQHASQRSQPPQAKEPPYQDCEPFNDSWDETYGEFVMGDYSYTASQILYELDLEAYHYERKLFGEQRSTDGE